MNVSESIELQLHRRTAEIATVVAFFGVLGFVTAIYRLGTDGPLLFDDYQYIIPLFDLSAENFRHDVLSLYPGGWGRPVSMASFAFNAATVGPEIAAWKMTNVALHAVCSLLAWWFLSLTIATSRLRHTPNQTDWSIGAIVALCWSAHPLNVSTVLYLVQRMTQLASIFCLSALITYMIGRHRQLEGRRGAAQMVASMLVLAPLSGLSKESGFLTYPLLIVLEVLLFSRFSSARLPISRRNVVFALLAVVVCGLIFAQLSGLGERILTGYSDRPFSLGERLLTETRVLMMYLRQILVPDPSVMTFFYDDLQLSRGVAEPISTMGSICVLSALLLTAIAVRKRLPLFSVGVLFFFIGHSIESTIVPLELAFEHRNYLPSVGVLMGAIAAIPRGFESCRDWRHCLWTTIVIVSLLGFTWERVTTWSNSEALALNALRYRPGSDYAVSLLAERHLQEGRLGEAKLILQNGTSNGRSLQLMYISCLEGQVGETVTLESVRRDFSPYVTSYMLTGLIELTNIVLNKQCGIAPAEMLGLLDLAVSRRMWGGNGSRQKINLYRAQLLDMDGRYSEAIELLTTEFERETADPILLFLAARIAAEHGEKSNAREMVKNAVVATGKNRPMYQEVEEEINKLLEGKSTDPNTMAPSIQ